MRTKQEPSAVEMEPSVKVASRKEESERPSSRTDESRKRERYEMGWRRLKVVATRSALAALSDVVADIAVADIAVDEPATNGPATNGFATDGFAFTALDMLTNRIVIRERESER